MTARPPRILAMLMSPNTRQSSLSWKFGDAAAARSVCFSATAIPTVDLSRPVCILTVVQGQKKRAILSWDNDKTATTINPCTSTAIHREQFCTPAAQGLRPQRTHRHTHQPGFRSKSGTMTAMRTVCTSAALQSQQSCHDNAQTVVVVEHQHQQTQEQVLSTDDSVTNAQEEFKAFIEGLPPLQHPKHFKRIIASNAESINKNIAAMTRKGETIYGLDIEWQPQFRKGGKENKTALIQICNSDTILLMQVHRLKYLPTGLTQFLREKRFLKSGVNIRGDALKLARDFAVECNGFVDVGTVCKHLYPEETRMSLRALTGSYLGFKMDKSKKVVLSNWSSIRLSQSQINYASLDAYASYKLSAIFCDVLKGLGKTSEDFAIPTIMTPKKDVQTDKRRLAGTKETTSTHTFPTSTTTVIKKAPASFEKASA